MDITSYGLSTIIIVKNLLFVLCKDYTLNLFDIISKLYSLLFYVYSAHFMVHQ